MTLESRRKEARWGSIALGWLVAVLAGVLVSPLLRALFGLRAEPPGVRGEFTAAEPASWSRASNQIRQAGTLRPGLPATLGLNGAMTAVFGTIFGMMLTVLEATYAMGVALPPVIFGSGVGAAIVSLVPFLVNLFGGFVGGTLGKLSAQR